MDRTARGIIPAKYMCSSRTSSAAPAPFASCYFSNTLGLIGAACAVVVGRGTRGRMPMFRRRLAGGCMKACPWSSSSSARS